MTGGPKMADEYTHTYSALFFYCFVVFPFSELTDFRIIYNVFRSIAIKDYIILRAMEEGLKVTLEEMRCVEISSYIPASMFSFYEIDSSQDVIFKLSFKTFVEILNIFGEEGNPSLKMYYKATEEPLQLM